MRVTLGGIIESCRNVVTKNGNKPMCFCKISDSGRSVEAVVFPRVYELTKKGRGILPIINEIAKFAEKYYKSELKSG